MEFFSILNFSINILLLVNTFWLGPTPSPMPKALFVSTENNKIGLHVHHHHHHPPSPPTITTITTIHHHHNQHNHNHHTQILS
jgi:hypothetical protein